MFQASRQVCLRIPRVCLHQPLFRTFFPSLTLQPTSCRVRSSPAAAGATAAPSCAIWEQLGLLSPQASLARHSCSCPPASQTDGQCGLDSHKNVWAMRRLQTRGAHHSPETLCPGHPKCPQGWGSNMPRPQAPVPLPQPPKGTKGWALHGAQTHTQSCWRSPAWRWDFRMSFPGVQRAPGVLPEPSTGTVGCVHLTTKTCFVLILASTDCLAVSTSVLATCHIIPLTFHRPQIKMV